MGFKTRYDFTTGRVATVATIATQNGEKHVFPQSVAKVAEVAGCESRKIMQGAALFPMPETPSTGDQDHAGEAGEPGPDEFAAHVAYCREAFKDGPPMIAQDMPDWSAFCVGYWRDCFHCPYYDGNPNGSPCELWEAAFPGKVMWHSIN